MSGAETVGEGRADTGDSGGGSGRAATARPIMLAAAERLRQEASRRRPPDRRELDAVAHDILSPLPAGRADWSHAARVLDLFSDDRAGASRFLAGVMVEARRRLGSSIGHVEDVGPSDD